MTLIIVALFAASIPIASARWLRVAQREHYLPGETTKFAVRWWRTGFKNSALFVVGVCAAIFALTQPWSAVIAIQVVAVAPLGLSMRGRTSPLAWTRRLRTLATVTAVLVVAIGAVGVALGVAEVTVAFLALGLPLIFDAALAVLAPVERSLSAKFVRSATERLDRVAPVRVAITGSFGKTTIKGYLRHLVEGTRSVLASPASFNNTGGLSRTVNEHLGQETEVFIAEMGTYGPGEISELCSWVRPDVAVLCNIGPVHLERFGTLETVVAAKSEIFETAHTAVINIDAFGMAEVAIGQREAGRKVITCSTDLRTGADVSVAIGDTGDLTLVAMGEESSIALPDGVPNINAAVAAATALALDIPLETIRTKLATLPGTSHRCEVSVSPDGVTVIDDTFNSNPAGAAAALEALAATNADRRVVVTPGMIELGSEQKSANTAFGAEAAAAADDVIIVGFTNQASLTDGAAAGPAAVHKVRFRNQAVEWVRANLGPGDAVLYENDLPDHYA